MKNDVDNEYPAQGKEMGQLLSELGCTVILGHRGLGAAIALKTKKDGFQNKAHLFITPAPFKDDGSLTDEAWKEIHQSGILHAVGHRGKSSSQRLAAIGAAAAVAGLMCLSIGASPVQADDELGYRFFGGANPL